MPDARWGPPPPHWPNSILVEPIDLARSFRRLGNVVMAGNTRTEWTVDWLMESWAKDFSNGMDAYIVVSEHTNFEGGRIYMPEPIIRYGSGNWETFAPDCLEHKLMVVLNKYRWRPPPPPAPVPVNPEPSRRSRRSRIHDAFYDAVVHGNGMIPTTGPNTFRVWLDDPAFTTAGEPVPEPLLDLPELRTVAVTDIPMSERLRETLEEAIRQMEENPWGRPMPLAVPPVVWPDTPGTDDDDLF